MLIEVKGVSLSQNYTDYVEFFKLLLDINNNELNQWNY